MKNDGEILYYEPHGSSISLQKLIGSLTIIPIHYMIHEGKSFVLYDKQGVFSKQVKKEFTNLGHPIFHSKNLNALHEFISQSSKEVHLIFIFQDERDLIANLRLSSEKVNIIYAPTNLKIYNQIKNFENIKVINLNNLPIDKLIEFI